MEAKKTPGADVNKMRGLFLQIGLIVAIGAAIAAFNYSKGRIEVQLTQQIAPDEEIYLPPVSRDEPQQSAAAVRSISLDPQVLRIVREQTMIEVPIDENLFDPGVIHTNRARGTAGAPGGVDGGEGDDPIPFEIIEFMPEFRNSKDLNTFRKWVASQISYPSEAAQYGVAGKVTLSFIIEKDGTLSNIEVIASPHSSLSAEAVRVLKNSPRWTPGRQRSSAVRVRYTMPVEFRLQ